MQLQTNTCKKGDILPLFSPKNSQPISPLSGHQHCENTLPTWAVGTELLHAQTALFKIVGRILQPLSTHARYLPLLKAQQDMHPQNIAIDTKKHGYSLAWITLSDKGFAGLRIDESGPRIEEMLRAHMPLSHTQGFILPDDALALRALVLELSIGQGYDIICTTGGTGLTERDVTPEAIMPILDKRLHGFEQAMFLASLQITPHAMLSRAVVGSINTGFGATMCITLPGSVKAVQENLTAILPAMTHALKKLANDAGDCAR